MADNDSLYASPSPQRLHAPYERGVSPPNLNDNASLHSRSVSEVSNLLPLHESTPPNANHMADTTTNSMLSPFDNREMPRRSSRAVAHEHDLHLPVPQSATTRSRGYSSGGTSPLSAYSAMTAGVTDQPRRIPPLQPSRSYENLPEVVAAAPSPAGAASASAFDSYGPDEPPVHVQSGLLHEKNTPQYHPDYHKRESRRKWLRRAVGIFVVLLILGLALGLGLGLGLKKQSASAAAATNTTVNATAPRLRITNKGGIATVGLDGSNDRLLYYRDPNGTVYEQRLTASDLARNPPTPSSNSTVDTITDMHPTAPMAATSFTYRNDVYKHLFYADNRGNILTVNHSSATNKWSPPLAIDSPAFTGNVTPSALTALAAWATGNATYPQLRVYFGSDKGLAEFRRDLRVTTARQTWRFTGYVPNVDTAAGFAVSAWPATGVVNVYFRAKTSGRLQQRWLKSINPSDASSYTNSATDNGIVVAANSALTASNDNATADIVAVLQGDDSGTVEVVKVSQPGSSDVSSSTRVSTSAVKGGGRIASEYVGGTTYLVYQDGDGETLHVLGEDDKGMRNVDGTVQPAAQR